MTGNDRGTLPHLVVGHGMLGRAEQALNDDDKNVDPGLPEERREFLLVIVGNYYPQLMGLFHGLNERITPYPGCLSRLVPSSPRSPKLGRSSPCYWATVWMTSELYVPQRFIPTIRDGRHRRTK